MEWDPRLGKSKAFSSRGRNYRWEAERPTGTRCLPCKTDTQKGARASPTRGPPPPPAVRKYSRLSLFPVMGGATGKRASGISLTPGRPLAPSGTSRDRRRVRRIYKPSLRRGRPSQGGFFWREERKFGESVFSLPAPTLLLRPRSAA